MKEKVQEAIEKIRPSLQADGGDIELLEEISEVTGAASLCALGKTAADPLLSTLRYFRDEYEAKIAEADTPAGKRE